MRRFKAACSSVCDVSQVAPCTRNITLRAQEERLQLYGGMGAHACVGRVARREELAKIEKEPNAVGTTSKVAANTARNKEFVSLGRQFASLAQWRSLRVEVRASVVHAGQRETPDGAIVVGAAHPFIVAAILKYASGHEMFDVVNVVARSELTTGVVVIRSEHLNAREVNDGDRGSGVGGFFLPLSFTYHPHPQASRPHHRLTPKSRFKIHIIMSSVGSATAG